MRVSGVHPIDRFWRLGRLEVQIHDDRLLPAADHHHTEGVGLARIDLLVGNERGNVNEIARPCLGDKLEAFTPSDAPSAANHIEDVLQISMVMAPVLASAWIAAVPAQSLVDPVRAWVIAAALVKPGVCGVLRSSCEPGMILTPWSRQFGFG